MYNQVYNQTGQYNQGQMSNDFELTVSARGLSSKDVLSNSDPFCVLYVKNGSKWSEVSRTETINDDGNPSWLKRFTLTHQPQSNQEIKFEVYDYDPATGNDFLGRVETTLTTILGSGSNGYRSPLVGSGFTGKSRTGGELLIKADVAPPKGTVSQKVTLQFGADKVESKDFIGKSDPYLVISRSLPDGSFTICHRTEHCKNTKKPTWNSFTVDSFHLCNGDWNRVIKIECFDWDDDSSHDFIGSCTTNLRRLSEGPSQGNIYELVNPAKIGKKNYTNSGFLKLLSCSIIGGNPSTQAVTTGGYQQQPATGYPPPPQSQAGYAPPPNTGAYPPQQAYQQHQQHQQQAGYAQSGAPGYPHAGPQQPGPQQPGPQYPPTGYPQSGAAYPSYPPTGGAGGYPPSSGYTQGPGFNTSQGYPTQGPGFATGPGYPGQPTFPTGYPPTGPTYPSAGPTYPNAGPNYPNARPGYPPY